MLRSLSFWLLRRKHEAGEEQKQRNENNTLPETTKTAPTLAVKLANAG